MSLNQIAFVIISVLALFGAIMVVASRRPVYSVLFLILTFFCIAAHFIVLNAEFLAVVQVIVYAGAVMVLFLFVVMLLNLNKESEPRISATLKVAAALSGGLLFLSTVAGVVKGGGFAEVAEAAYPFTQIGYVDYLGKALFNEFLIPFEIVSVLFLSAMVGAVVLGRKD